MSIKSFLDQSGVLAHVVLPTEIAILFSVLTPIGAPTSEGAGITFTGVEEADGTGLEVPLSVPRPQGDGGFRDVESSDAAKTA